MNLIKSIVFMLVIFLIGCAQQKNANVETKSINPQLNFKPNILWVVAEDLSPYIPSFGDSTVVTPTLNRLAAEGVCYENFYASAPVCSPARASIITGMYPNHIGASHMRTGPWAGGPPSEAALQTYASRLPEGLKPYEAIPPDNAKMFSEIMRMNGYYTTNNAKQDYQFITTLTAWDQNGRQAHWRNRPKGKPFFSVFNFEVSHESRIWSKADDSLWVDANLEVPVPPYLPNTEVGIKDVRRMYSNVVEMDYQVGKILEQLEEDGLLDSTIVMWYTDHGGPLPRHKRLLYESGLKVPMIVRFPNKLFAGQRDDRMINFVDLAPTVLSLAGLKPPENMDGSAFLGENLRDIEPKYVYATGDRFDENTDRNRTVRDDRYRYIKYYQPEKSMFLHVPYRDQMPIMQELYRLRDNNELTEAQAQWFRDTKPEEELFDCEKDPHNLINLAGNPQYADKLSELRQANEDWVTSISDTGLKPELELFRELWPDGVQPKTADPIVILNNNRITISCETEGASLGFQWLDSTQEPGDSWEVYKEPIEAVPGKEIVVVSHRIGYVPGKIVRQ